MILYVDKYIQIIFTHMRCLSLRVGYVLAAVSSTLPSTPSGSALMLQLHHIYELLWNSSSSVSTCTLTCLVRYLKIYGSLLPCLLYIVANNIHLLDHWIFWIKHLGSFWAPACIRHNLWKQTIQLTIRYG